MWANVIAWLDSYHLKQDSLNEAIAWSRIVPLVALHVIALVGLFTFSIAVVDIAVAVSLYLVRMFAITGFFHRYFAHKAFQTSRWHQFFWGFLGTTATQRGPLWWAAHHRRHHQHTETADDPHNARRGFWWSHMGWFLSEKHFRTDQDAVRDLAKYPELVWLDRFDIVPPIILAALHRGQSSRASAACSGHNRAAARFLGLSRFDACVDARDAFDQLAGASFRQAAIRQ